jgi:hypothetical protein
MIALKDVKAAPAGLCSDDRLDRLVQAKGATSEGYV